MSNFAQRVSIQNLKESNYSFLTPWERPCSRCYSWKYFLSCSVFKLWQISLLHSRSESGCITTDGFHAWFTDIVQNIKVLLVLQFHGQLHK